jgi:hypothetical protein
MLKYHTIEIEPMKKVLRHEGRIETEGLKRALHICRGHFAHYPETEPGLFGKGIQGDFWKRAPSATQMPFRGQVDDPATSRRIFPPRCACATASLMDERG